MSNFYSDLLYYEQVSTSFSFYNNNIKKTKQCIQKNLMKSSYQQNKPRLKLGSINFSDFALENIENVGHFYA